MRNDFTYLVRWFSLTLSRSSSTILSRSAFAPRVRFGVTSAIMDVRQLRCCAINSFCLEHEQHGQPWRRVLGVTVLGATSGEGFSSPYKLLSHFYCAPHCKRCTSYGNSVCLSVRPSVTRRYCVKTTARSTVQFALSDRKNVSSFAETKK